MALLLPIPNIMELPPALSIIFFDMYRPRNIKRTIGSTQYISRDTHGEVCRCISPENFAPDSYSRFVSSSSFTMPVLYMMSLSFLSVNMISFSCALISTLPICLFSVMEMNLL